ncbi:MAG: hypothetical protein KAI47_10925, partial [Deltaproteobacteria bacterium]|nr:hypothetical protein [Deltaproteobacteria bacterium]
MFGSSKIGEILVEAREITAMQLRRALAIQSEFGGRLGSRLIQLGAVTADIVARFLAQQHDVKPAMNAMFMSASRDALNALDPGICQAHMIFPLLFDRSSKVLALAMLDPGDLGAVDRLGEKLQMLIDPYAAPEIQIRTFLADHYKISSSLYEQKGTRGGTKDLATVGSRMTRTSDGEYAIDWLSPSSAPPKAKRRAPPKAKRRAPRGEREERSIIDTPII